MVGNGRRDPIAGSGERLVVIVAHPDDESFACGSLIAGASAAGGRVTVICATNGDAGERVPDPETDAQPLGEVRERELRAAATLLGVDAIELLGYADSGFDGPLPAAALGAVPVEDLATVAPRAGQPGQQPDAAVGRRDAGVASRHGVSRDRPQPTRPRRPRAHPGRRRPVPRGARGRDRVPPSQHPPFDGLSPELRRAFLGTDFVVGAAPER
jgi:LmbE family N-acetylglucosaminyl deacetylase